MSTWDNLARDDEKYDQDQVESDEEEYQGRELPRPPSNLNYAGTTGLDSDDEEQEEQEEEEDTPIAQDSDDEEYVPEAEDEEEYEEGDEEYDD